MDLIQFLSYLRHDNGNLSTFWMSYVDMVGDILLGLIRVSREGNWQLHLFAIRKTIPWCFVYDSLNYARYLPAYYAQMINLQTDHPQVYQHFSKGGLSVQLADDNPFGRIPVDQATEVSVNKDTQTVGGTTKYSQKSGAVKRYYLTAEHQSAFLGQLRDMTQVNQSALHHSELQKPRIDRCERAVAAVVELLENWTNPFEGSQDIVSLSSANVAPKDATHDLLRAHSTGEEAYDSFKRERLEEASPKKQFHDPMRKTRQNNNIHQYREKEAFAYQWKCCHLEGRQVAFWQDYCHCSEQAVEHEFDFRAPRRVQHLQNAFQTSLQR